MKVAFLLSRIEQSGVTTHTLDLSKGLLDLGHEVCLITGGKVPNSTSRVDDFYFEFKHMGVLIKEFKTPTGNPLAKGYQSVTSILKMIRDLKDFKPDVIHCQSPYMTFVPWLMRTKFTTTIHILYLKRNIKFKNPTHLIAISQESYEFSKTAFGIKEKDMTLIHHGVAKRYSEPIPSAEKQRLRERLGILEDKLVIGFAGSISLRKGTDILIGALKGLNDATKKRIHMVFLGGVENSEEHHWLNTMIQEAEVSDLITYVPFEDPKPFYDIFDIFVLPSRMESFPLVTIEAMMSECCPLRSSTEGAYEQVDHGTTGLLFENENIEEFITALETLVNDSQLRKRLAKNAKKKALEQFTIPVMTKKTLEVYKKIKIY